ncbi:MAG: RNA pseudouridine synthase [Candidatus Melainabacteria bacterium]|nr:MAG: RNA pseudouridine synthase [Candidatus Melainabacteria bacterium]
MEDSKIERIELVVDQFDPGDAPPLRLDQFLADRLSQFSRARIQKFIADGEILVDGHVEKASHRLRPNQKVVLNVPPVKDTTVHAEAIPLDIVYDDDHLAVVNKPAGMVTHPGAGVQSGTLVHALLHHLGSSLSGISGILRPGIVHRLDKDTSGLLVIAKDDLTHRQLSRQIQAKMAGRTYLAILEGELKQDEGEIKAPIGRHPVHRKKMAIVATGKPAESHFTVLKRAPGFVLAEVKLRTGRTHQIRVHMTSLNCPVVGDLVYNKKTTGSMAARGRLQLHGHALHATKLSFFHPANGRLLEFEAELPDDLKRLSIRLFG